MQILFLILMFVLGAIFGSFLCCQARRLHQDKKNKNKFSVCLHCHKRIKFYDNIPIISWLALKGKCRYCHKDIGLAEIISELVLAFTFLALGTYFLTINSTMFTDLLSDFPIISPMSWTIFITTLIFTLSLAFLAIYDGLYGELPNFSLTISAICAIILLILQTGNSFLVAGFFDWGTLWQLLAPPLASAALFGGIYLVLYLISKGKWVGDGDWILAAIIGLALGSPWLSMVALLIANLAACIIMYPLVKKKKNHQIYFGPFLVLAFVITYLLSDFIMSMI